MTFPALTLAFILATLYGALFHLFTGGDARRLALFLVTSWIAFGIGQALGSLINLTLLPVGVLHLFAASLASWTALFGIWLVLRRRRLLT